ncbi:MAG: hypothetical protein ACYDEY_00325 [Acidimicrobiales bacterium]
MAAGAYWARIGARGIQGAAELEARNDSAPARPCAFLSRQPGLSVPSVPSSAQQVLQALSCATTREVFELHYASELKPKQELSGSGHLQVAGATGAGSIGCGELLGRASREPG